MDRVESWVEKKRRGTRERESGGEEKEKEERVSKMYDTVGGNQMIQG